MYRAIFPQLLETCKTNKVLLLVGARQVGKTTLMQQLQEQLKDENKQTYFLTLEKRSTLALLDKNPENIFQLIPPGSSQIYVFIDEIQYLSDPTNFLKYLYDSYKQYIKLIVSGSSSFYIDKKFKNSLVGRKNLFHITTCSFEEILLAHDQQELVGHLKIGKMPGMYQDILYNYYYSYITYGGYPEVVLAESIEQKQDILAEIAEDYIKKDLVDADVKYEDVYFKIMKILAHQVGNLVNAQQIANSLDVTLPTVKRYLYIMQKSFHVALIQSYYNNPKKELKKMPKVYFLDMGLKNYFQRNFESYDERVDTGAHLENIVYRQLLEKYAHQAIKFWRDKKKHEVDFVIDDRQKIYALEVKNRLKKYNAKKYRFFTDMYPDISLTPIDLEGSIYLPYV